ncbi:MAG: ABC transporter permease [Terriglobales bacterium]
MAGWVAHVRQRLPPLGLGPEREPEIIAELAGQLEQAYEAARAAGSTAAEARRRAEAEVTDWRALAARILAAERPAQAALARRLPWRLRAVLAASDGARDLRRALRGWRRAPGLVLAAVLTLGLGLGASVWMFSFVNAELLEPLPFPQSGRLMAVLESSREFHQIPFSWPDYLDWRADNRTFTQLAAVRGSDMVLTHLGPATFAQGLRVTANFFAMLGGKPMLGRTFTAAEDGPGAADVVVLSQAFFRQRLGGDRRWLGRTLELDGRARTIIGVMPSSFRGLDGGAQFAFWTPLGAHAARDPSWANRANRAGLFAIGRLRDGSTAVQAEADLSTIAASLARAYPKADAGVGVNLQPLVNLFVAGVRPALWILLAAAMLLLLIACANVANLLLARAASRRHDLAVQQALGISRGRLLRQQLAESLLLAAGGCLLGLALAALALRYGAAIGASVLPRVVPTGLDLRAAAVAATLALLTGLACGLPPALRRWPRAVTLDLRENARLGGTGRRLRGALTAAEMALAMVLLVGAALLLRSVHTLQHADLGFTPDGVQSFIVGLPTTAYPQRAQQLEFFRQAVDRMARLPGVAAAAGVYPLPISGASFAEPILLAGRPAPAPGHAPETDIFEVRGNYFGAMDIHLLAGRAFTADDDGAAPPVAIVDRALARQFFPGPDPVQAALGAQLVLDGVQRTIAGVVVHVQDRSLTGHLQPETYIPQAQAHQNTAALSFVIRPAAGASAGLERAAIAQIGQLDPNLPVTNVEPLAELVAGASRLYLHLESVMDIFALLALALAAAGIYSVLSYAVAERQHEIGLRMALGSSRSGVVRLIVAQGMRTAVIGSLAGLGLAALTGRALAAELIGVGPADPLSWAGAAAVLLGVAVLACALPAWRAARLDPLSSLRHE